MSYGLTIPRGPFGMRSVIGRIETSPSGNVILRVGREHDRPVHGSERRGGWEQTEHVVLEQAEAREMIAELVGATGGAPPLLAQDEAAEPELFTHPWVRERALRALVALEDSDSETLHEILEGLATYEPASDLSLRPRPSESAEDVIERVTAAAKNRSES